MFDYYLLTIAWYHENYFPNSHQSLTLMTCRDKIRLFWEYCHCGAHDSSSFLEFSFNKAESMKPLLSLKSVLNNGKHFFLLIHGTRRSQPYSNGVSQHILGIPTEELVAWIEITSCTSQINKTRPQFSFYLYSSSKLYCILQIRFIFGSNINRSSTDNCVI